MATDLSLEVIDSLKPGTYRLPKAPTADQLKNLLYFKNETAEAGIMSFNGNWFIGLNDGLAAVYPAQDFRWTRHSLEMHTHPVSDTESRYPSYKVGQDISHLKYSKDGTGYIICHAGIVEYSTPSEAPAGYPDYDGVDSTWQAFGHYVREVLGLSEEEYYENDGWNIMDKFLKKYYGYRVIDWDEAVEIERILRKGDTFTQANQGACVD